MGIYSNSGYMNERIEDIQEAYGYDNDEYSAQIAMIEGYQNSFMIFDGVIRSDIQESAMRFQGVDEAEVMAFSEGVIGDLFNKIKEFFKKIWAKIKSIFHNFMAKFDAKFGKSNKEFIKKYRKDIYGKDLSDFEVEYRKPTGNTITISPEIVNDFDLTGIMATLLMNPQKVDNWIQKQKDDNDYTCELLEATCNNKISISNPSEYEKEVMDYWFDEPSKDSINLTAIVDDMMSFKDLFNKNKKYLDSMNKVFNGLIKMIDKDQQEALKLQPDEKRKAFKTPARVQYMVTSTGSGLDTRSTLYDTTKRPMWLSSYQLQRYKEILNFCHRRANCVQTVGLKTTSIIIKCMKFENAQNRRILAKVVAYKRKEEAFAEDFADLIEWEFDCVGVY